MEHLGYRTLMEIRKEAAAWLIEMDAEPERWNRKTFVTWLKSSPRHMEEFLEQSGLWGALDEADFGEIDLERVLAEAGNVRNLPKGTQSRPKCARDSKRNQWLAGLAAIMLVCVAVVSVWRLSDHTQALVTAVGEQRAMKLPDHSVVHMNTNSRVEIRFTDRTREVRLVQGEALFSVEHDAQRPFRVIANGIAVEALGTQFNVRRRNSDTIVSVVEGRVAVVAARPESVDVLPDDIAAESAQAGALVAQDKRDGELSVAMTAVPANAYRAGAGRLAVLAAGEQARIALDGTIEQHRLANLAAPIAWRERELIFVDTPLSEVAAELARYNVAPRLEIEGEEVQSRQVSGVFAADDPESLIQFLARDNELAVTRVGETVVIRSR